MQYLEVSVQPYTFDVCKFDNTTTQILASSIYMMTNRIRIWIEWWSIDFNAGTYGMVVTVATVGYGDISPKTTLGRFAGKRLNLLFVSIGR